MRFLRVIAASALLMAAASGQALAPSPEQSVRRPSEGGKKSMESMQITRAGTQPSQPGPAQSFTGAVRLDMLFAGQQPSRTSAAYVTFEPCARTAWHTHPLGPGQVAQITYHLNRAMDHGLTKAQASEALTQLAFYAGWPNVFSAMPVVKAVFESRKQP